MDCRTIFLIGCVVFGSLQAAPTSDEDDDYQDANFTEIRSSRRVFPPNTKVDYYWKDYFFQVPEDAYPAGVNAKGEPTYFGQVLYKNFLIPAKIDGYSLEALYEWGTDVYKATRNVKILCTKNPEKFIWVETDNEKLRALKEILIIGGYEDGIDNYLGRKQYDEELAIGKIISTKHRTMLNAIRGEKCDAGVLKFQVLTYDPKKTSTYTASAPEAIVETTVPSVEVHKGLEPGAPENLSIKATDPCKNVIVNVYN